MADQRTVLLLGADVVGWGELRQILADLPGVRVGGDTADLHEARRLAAAHAPDVIIAAATDTATPLLPQLAALRRACCPAAKIAVVAHRYTPGQVRAPLEAGIVGYLLWADLSGAVLRHALALLLVGDVVVGSRGVVTAFVAGLRGDAAARQAAAGISARERAILGHLAARRSYAAIAAAEGLGARTVERLVAGLEAKLDAPTHFVLALRAARLGLIR